LTYDVGVTPHAGDGPPAFGDFTLDGKPDTIAGRGATHDFVVALGAPPSLAEFFDPAQAFSHPVLVEDSSTNPWLGITVNLPEDVGGHNYVQAILWWSEDGDELEPAAIENLAFGGPGLDPEEAVDVWLPLADAVDGMCPADFGQVGFAVTVRLVTWTSGNPTVSAASSPLHAIFAWDEDTITAMVPPDSPYTTLVWDENCDGPEPGVGYNPVASLPPKRSGTPPSAPQITTGNPPSL
jgi:hypothetical protein